MKRLHRPILRAGAGGYGFIRSLNPAAWFRADTGVTVTGLGVSTWADQSGNGRDLLQGTDANRPPYLSYSGTKYLYLPGVAGNYASTPDSAANSITGDIDIRVRVALDNWTLGTQQGLVSKFSAAGWVWSIVPTTGVVRLYDGTSNISSTVAPTVSNKAAIWLRVAHDVNNGAGGRTTTFYTAADSSTEPTSWTQLGDVVVTATAANLNDPSAAVEVGTYAGGTLYPAAGKVYRAIIKSGIDGTTVVDFNPDLDGSDQAATITSSATGEVWTINKGGGLPAQIVGRPSLLFDGTADYLKTNAFTLNQPETVYVVFKQVSWTNGDTILDGNSASTGRVYQDTSTPKLGGTTDAAKFFTPANGPAIGTYGVVAAVFNGASSILVLNGTTIASNDVGTGNMGGLTVGAAGNNLLFSNIQALEILCFASAHDATQRARVIQYCAGRHGIAL